ncbi:hypothetical protein AVEN_187587-1 [Araneus ventricosus]|uniref:Fibrinogen C-terminal domain-containing protein n=1 Tax=Araneus ventricosus TaxID=182803 RepID=A0A4Y2FU64_ARAVE|nr:hypothetical protein AVEN_187587-1 [Araneus ventricosus]
MRKAAQVTSKCPKVERACGSTWNDFDTFEGPTSKHNPVDCEEVLEADHNEGGVYTVWTRSRVTGDRRLEVFCDMDTDGMGWTVRTIHI